MARRRSPLQQLGIGQLQRGPFARPLTKKRFRREVKAARKLQFGPLKRQIRGERRASRQQEQRVKDFFKEFKGELTQSQQGTKRAFGQAEQQIGAQAQSAADFAEKLRQQREQERSAEAQRLGQSSVPRQGSDVAVQANLARLNAANILRGVTSAQGASQRAFFQRAKSTAGREKVEQRLREQARRRSFGADLRDIAKQEGALGTQLRGQARGQERDFLLGLLGIAGSRAGRRLQKQLQQSSQRHSSSEAAKERRARRREAAKDRKASGGKDALSPAEQRARRKSKREGKQNRQGARTALETLRDRQFQKVPKAKVIGDLMDKFGISRSTASKMYEREADRRQNVGRPGGR